MEKIQFGALYRPGPGLSRMFAAEYEQEFVSGNKTAWLDMSYDHKDIHIDVCCKFSVFSESVPPTYKLA